MKKLKISFIGAGNVGTQYSKRLFELGHSIESVFSRRLKRAAFLSEQVLAQPVNALKNISLDSDLYIIAVNDDAIASVVQTLSAVLPKDAMLVHTSGATGSDVFKKHFKNYGVLYPYQTMKGQYKVKWKKLPICICASNDTHYELLESLAKEMSVNVHQINDEQRAYLHICGVFVNNFTNHLFHIGQTIADEAQIPFDLLRPLIKTTFKKIKKHKPSEVQTGPAIRKDEKTIEFHLEHLKDFPDYQAIYKEMTQSIQKTIKK